MSGKGRNIGDLWKHIQGLRVHVETVRMAFTDTAIILIVIAVLGTQTRCQGSLVKDNSLLRFTHHLYNASIYENSAPRTYTESPVRMGIILSDPFWDVKYKIVSGDDDGLFKVEEITVGDFCFLRIKTRSSYSAVLNREVRDIYTLTVEATESTYDNHARTKVSIQVLDTNDLKPLFYPASYHVAIKEDTPIKSSLVGVSATDADIGSNAEFYYSFTTRSHPFAVDPFTGTITLIKTLDASQRDRYELTVLAEDRTKKISGVQKFGNVAKVVVIIQNVTENFALITPTSTATPQTDDDKISLNIKMEPKEKEKVASLNLVVVLEDINDNPPKFVPTVYRIKVPEDVPPGSVLLWVESFDLDLESGGLISYNLKNSEAGAFFLDTSTGCLTLERELDFEKQQFYNLTVRAVDHGKPRSLSSSCFIEVEVLDVNENLNRPLFTQFVHNAAVMEDATVGTSVLTLTTVDNDLGRDGVVRYYIHDGSGLGIFTIDEETGMIVITTCLSCFT
ncbi:hypothetical protein cypCar_00019139 [Cyprinus carpio]|nr:hypothetical protein cypCar_00019139 [Cyprinus carpio]